MKKFALALMTSAVAVLGFSAGAQAQQAGPYGGTPAVEVSPATAPPGGTVTVTVTGCTTGEVLTVTFAGATTTTTCVASGATTGVTAPSAAGTYSGTIVGSLGFSQSFQVVVAAAATPPGGLPATGSGGVNSMITMAGGLFAVGLGLFGVTLFRRRQAAVVA